MNVQPQRHSDNVHSDHTLSEHAHTGHGSGHVHATESFGTAFAVGIALNLTFVAVEFVYGVLANSMALVADAGHNLSDVLSLAIAWIASVLTRRPPSSLMRRVTFLFPSTSFVKQRPGKGPRCVRDSGRRTEPSWL